MQFILPQVTLRRLAAVFPTGGRGWCPYPTRLEYLKSLQSQAQQPHPGDLPQRVLSVPGEWAGVPYAVGPTQAAGAGWAIG